MNTSRRDRIAEALATEIARQRSLAGTGGRADLDVAALAAAVETALGDVPAQPREGWTPEQLNSSNDG